MSAEILPPVPLLSVDCCSVCGCGLCGIRICGLDTDHPHGLVVCDECEAIWTEPDTGGPHQWRDSDQPCCPICGELLWSPHSRWATREDLQLIGWQQKIDADLNAADAVLNPCD